jgi:hypothetical protein
VSVDRINGNNPGPPPWMPLLKQLTDVCPQWVVWKNVDTALGGTGDIDAAAPESAWSLLIYEFRRWAADFSLGPIVVCRHIPSSLNLVAVPRDARTFLEMGVKSRRIWRGATLFDVDELHPLVSLDPRGFRRLQPGAEGLLKFVLNGVRRGGLPNWEALRSKCVLDQLRVDPDGMRRAARLFGPAERAVIKAAERALAGEWDRSAALAVETWAVLRALRQPAVALRRLQFRAITTQSCPVVTTLLKDHRRIPDDRDGWIRLISRTHSVFAEGARANGQSGRNMAVPGAES